MDLLDLNLLLPQLSCSINCWDNVCVTKLTMDIGNWLIILKSLTPPDVMFYKLLGQCLCDMTKLTMDIDNGLIKT